MGAMVEPDAGAEVWTKPSDLPSDSPEARNWLLEPVRTGFAPMALSPPAYLPLPSGPTTMGVAPAMEQEAGIALPKRPIGVQPMSEAIKAAGARVDVGMGFMPTVRARAPVTRCSIIMRRAQTASEQFSIRLRHHELYEF